VTSRQARVQRDDRVDGLDAAARGEQPQHRQQRCWTNRIKPCRKTCEKASARVIVSRIEDQGKGQHNAYVDFEIPRAQIDAIEKALASAGETYNRSVNAAADAENVTDSKVQFKLAISPASALPAARETDALGD